MPPQVRSETGPTGDRNPLAEGALRRRPTFASRDEAFENYSSKPPFSALDPDALRAYVDHGFADEPDGTVRLKCRTRDRGGGLPDGRQPRRVRPPGRGRVPGHGRPRGRGRRLRSGRWSAVGHRRRPPPRSAATSSPTSATSGRSRTRRHRQSRRASLEPAVPLARGCHTPGVTSEPWLSTLPYSLSPSKVSTFTDCALAFRFSAIDRLPEPPSAPATKGTLVHAALERLFCLPADRAHADGRPHRLDQAIDGLRTDPEFTGLELDDDGRGRLPRRRRASSSRRYFELEDPTTITPIGLELKLEVEVGDLRLRGIIDRLELDDDGGWSSPTTRPARSPEPELRAGHASAACTSTPSCASSSSASGPARVQLLYLARARGHHHHAHRAVHPWARAQGHRHLDRRRAGLRAATTSGPDRHGPCNWCSFQAYCPAFGGDPDAAKAAVEPVAVDLVASPG